MATGPIDYSSQSYFGVFNARHSGSVQGLSREDAARITELSPLPFADLAQDSPVYGLTGRLSKLTLTDGHLQAAAIPESITEDNQTQVSNLFSHLNIFFVKAAEDYKGAVINGRNIEECHAKYLSAKNALSAAVHKFKPTEASGPTPLILECDSFTTACENLEHLYTESSFYNLPLRFVTSSLQGQERAHGALLNFRAVSEYLETGHGRLASEEVKKEFLRGVVFDLHQSLNDLPVMERATFENAHMQNANEIDYFTGLKFQLFKKLSKEEFNRQVMRYLFSDQPNPSEDLTRCAYMDPAQKGKLLEWQALKKQALEQGQASAYHKLPTQLLTKAFYALEGAFNDWRLGSSKTAQQIILDVFYEDTSSWFPGRSYGEAFGDDSNEDLRVLANTEETGMKAQRARCEALESLARRTQEAMQSAMILPRGDIANPRSMKMPIVTRIEHACTASSRAGVLLELRHLLQGLEDEGDKVFLRLAVLGQWDYQFGEAFFRGADKSSSYRSYQRNFEDAQQLLNGPVFKANLPNALLNAIALSDQDIRRSGLTVSQQEALLCDDLEFYARFIPSFTVEDSYGGATYSQQREYQHFARRFGKDLTDVQKAIDERLATEKPAIHEANTRAQTNALTALAAPAAPEPAQYAAIRQALALARDQDPAAIDAAEVRALASKLTVTAANPEDVILTSDYLLDRFQQLIAKARALKPAPEFLTKKLLEAGEYSPTTFNANKTQLLSYLQREMAHAQRTFATSYEPDMQRKALSHAQIYQDLRSIEIYIARLEYLNDRAAALVANLPGARRAVIEAQKPTGGFLGFGMVVDQEALARAEQAYKEVKQALTIPSPLNSGYPEDKHFKLPITLRRYARPAEAGAARA